MGKYQQKVQNMHKQAFLGTVDSMFKDYVLPAYQWLMEKSMVTAPLLGVGGAYALSKATKPTHITDNSDKELYLNTLKTEVAAARKQLAAIEAEKEMKGSARKVFDKFLG